MTGRWTSFAILTGAVVAAYWGVLGLSLHSEDFELIADGIQWGLGGGGFLRPVVVWVLHLVHALVGWRPAPFHALILVVHVASCWLLLALLTRWLESRPAALAGALVLAVHPIASEAVIWVSALTSSLVTLGILGTVLCWDHMLADDGARRWWLAATVGCLLLSLLTKESAAVVVALLMAVATARGVRLSEIRASLSLVGGLTAVYLAVYAFRFDLAAGSPVTLGYHGLRNLRHFLLSAVTLRPFQDRALVHVDRLLGLTDIGGVSPSPLDGGWPLVVTGAYLALALAALILVKTWSRWVGLGLAWIVIAGATLYLRPFHVLDWSYPFPSRYFYLPLVGVAIVVAAVVGRAVQGRDRVCRLAAAGGVLIVVVVGVIGVNRRMGDWREASRMVELTLVSFQAAIGGGAPDGIDRIALVDAIDHHREAFVFRNGLEHALRARCDSAVPVVATRDREVVRRLMKDERAMVLWWDAGGQRWRRVH